MSASLYLRSLFRVKSADQIFEEEDAESRGEPGLSKSMGVVALTLFSVGSIVGTGIFIVLGQAVPAAGPAVVISFLLAAVACTFSALSYAELASTIPVAGSSYSYAYATLGEIVAWVVAWCLMLEYGLAVSAVAVGWGQYLNEFLTLAFNLQLPPVILNPPGQGGIVNIPAILVIVLCTIFLIRGTSESATFNSAMVLLKVAVLLFFCAVAFTSFNGNHFEPFLPLGVAGVGLAASQIFFSFIGFDGVSTAGEEAKNPRRDLPIAIIVSLIIVALLYILVAVAAIGAEPWQTFKTDDSEAVLASIALKVTGGSWAPIIISIGAVISIISVVLVTMFGHTRILFAMGRDGLLPKVFTRVSPRTHTPVWNTVIVAVIVATLAGFVTLEELADATSIGTLMAFTVVNIGVLVLRRTRPDLPRKFKVPFGPVLPILGIAMNIYILSGLREFTWEVFVIWMALGMILYFGYSKRHSIMQATTSRVGKSGN